MHSTQWRLGFWAVGTLLVSWAIPFVAPFSLAQGNVITSSDPQLVGSGTLATEVREVEEFNEISASSAIKLDVTVGPAVAIAVTADDNILPHVKTEVTSGRLKLYVDDSYSSKSGVTIQLSVPELRGLRASGAVKATVKDVSGERFRLGLSGASECKWKGDVEALAMKLDGGSKVAVSGSAGRLEMNCSGAAKVNARDLETKTVKAVLSGASTARLNASEDLSVEASGASSLKYAGQPTVKLKVSGASKVSAE